MGSCVCRYGTEGNAKRPPAVPRPREDVATAPLASSDRRHSQASNKRPQRGSAEAAGGWIVACRGEQHAGIIRQSFNRSAYTIVLFPVYKDHIGRRGEEAGTQPDGGPCSLIEVLGPVRKCDHGVATLKAPAEVRARMKQRNLRTIERSCPACDGTGLARV